jgi:PmbA protein
MVAPTLRSRRYLLVVALKQEEMQRLAERAVSLAEKRGADEAEVFVYQSLTTDAAIKQGQIARSSRIIDRGLGVRTIVNRKTGFSYTNSLESEDTIEETVIKALDSARASKPDENWRGLTSKKAFPSVKGTYDKEIVQLDSAELVKIASTMLDAAEETDKRILAIEGGAGASCLCKAVANSNGVGGVDQGTIVECGLETIAKGSGGMTPSCFEFDIRRNYDMNPEWVGKEAARLAISALKAKRTKIKNMNVVFTQFALQQLLQYTLINAVKADYVQRNQSAFKNKIGEKVASEIVRIYDDGLLDGGIRTWKFDGEGVPQQKTLIIEKGVLLNYIYDNYTAKKEGKESTGNAWRAGYLSTPNVEATNFRIMPGNKSPEELVSQLEEGLLVYYLQGAHSSNPASGEFSVVATPAWKIENGEISYPVKGAMLAGNAFQVLTNTSDLANNERKIGQLVAPWVLVENVKVVGK